MIVRGIPRESRSVPDSHQEKSPSNRMGFFFRFPVAVRFSHVALGHIGPEFGREFEQLGKDEQRSLHRTCLNWSNAGRMAGSVSRHAYLLRKRRPVRLEGLVEGSRHSALLSGKQSLQSVEISFDAPIVEVCGARLLERVESGAQGVAEFEDNAFGSRSDHHGSGLETGGAVRRKGFANVRLGHRIEVPNSLEMSQVTVGVAWVSTHGCERRPTTICDVAERRGGIGEVVAPREIPDSE